MGLLKATRHDHHGEISWSHAFRCGGEDEGEDGDAERQDDVQPAFACAVGVPCVCAPIGHTIRLILDFDRGSKASLHCDDSKEIWWCG